MKYWLFEHGDVVGPFTVDELSGREGFGPHSLVCPEERGDDDTFWKEAESYEDFAPAAAPAPVPEPQEIPSAEPVEKKDVFDEELDTLLSEKNPLGETETPAGEPAEKVHFPMSRLNPARLKIISIIFKGGIWATFWAFRTPMKIPI